MDIVTAQEMYERDQTALEVAGLEGKWLMENAGRAVTYDLLAHIHKEHRIVVLIGAGNNGGDGFVIARTLLNLGYDVEAWQVVPDAKITGDAEAHKRIFQASGHPYRRLKSLEDLNTSLCRADVCIDAMLGIGVKGRLREPYADIVRLCNEKAVMRLAVDLPTGVPADEGEKDFEAFEAHYTSIIEAPKLSLFLQHAQPFYGKWSVVEIGLPVKQLPDHRRRLWEIADVKKTLTNRDAYSHKGSHGKGLVIGGSRQMPGSVAMTARAALRSGAGLIAISTDPGAISSISPFIQEATFVEGGGQVPDVSGYDGVAVGMGMGRESLRGEWIERLVCESKTPLLIDADGLYLLKNSLDALKQREIPTVLTPHPGEFAHLTGLSIGEILQSPFSHSKDFAERYGVYLVLKGPSTIITGPDGEQRVDVSGNSGLAKGGSGDVLSGILLSMMMQTDCLMDALSNGCVLHGFTADLLVQDGHSKVDLLASDVIEGLSRTFRTLSSSSISLRSLCP
ncbi:NAD(P)H-hydrate epimerase [Halobacillus karajensis]|uniref:Bifunctional NAD(P)H-hydrate repair enzyme n=1 Tax=Halobacillus karajensis TaxID=195088 RepID=A0A024P923_9BACI|nr:NAD(P)H-hydrate dehydratase [Halobacillus karajensis]CDQ21505.1 Nicotinamide nucleotide repair protein [Halobacillus karajensis]CDQ25440.1 Nicotinamide nucleotide repair protein [Halobacillus karajensis]CDQ29029.1 Nicotinamide nucleotide repair protein [Halobacillus karajensis]SEI09405.1 NAD(P)H-hydrate epimerase [Halobacillus karajensis]